MTTADILGRFGKLSALVVGDVCLDRWATYEPAASEPSRETGIPRIGVIATEVTPGAGGTVAGNLAALGAGRVAVLGVVGDDGHGFELECALRRRDIETDMLVEAWGRQTFTYTKLLNARTGVEDLPRVDFIPERPPEPAIEAEILGRLRAAAPSFDAILVSDQAEKETGGVVTPAVRAALAGLATERPGRLIWVDSRLRCDRFRRVLVKPNEQEAEEASRRLFGRLDYQALRRHIEAGALVVTHGARGALVVEDGGETWAPAKPVENPVDICGAGDSFSAGAALALAVTGSVLEAARFGNLVASITIRKKGTGTASPEEVLAACRE